MRHSATPQPFVNYMLFFWGLVLGIMASSRINDATPAKMAAFAVGVGVTVLCLHAAHALVVLYRKGMR